MEIYQDSLSHWTIFRSVFSGIDRIVTYFIITIGGKITKPINV